MDEDTANAALDAAKTAAETQPITTVIEGAPTPAEMLKRARAAGKTDAEINAFAASQPMKPIAIKGTRVFVQDCFGRTFGFDNIPDKELAALVAKGVPYTPYSNRDEMRNDARGGHDAGSHRMQLAPRATLRQMQAELAPRAAMVRAALAPSMRNVLATIERGTKVSRKEYETLLAEVTKVEAARTPEAGTVEFGDMLAAQSSPLNPVRAASAALGLDDAVVARIVACVEAAKRDAPVPDAPRDFEVEDAASAMIALALDTAGSRVERLSAALDKLDTYAAFRAGRKGKALELFLARYEREVENDGATG